MLNYVLRRLALMVPTLLGILLVSFVIIQFVPGGPVEQLVHQLQGASQGAEGGGASAASGYRGRQGLDKEQIAEIEPSMALTSLHPRALSRCWGVICVSTWARAFITSSRSGR